ncbi:MAG: glycoside hydrolase family 19 protein [Chitinophagaceae bacterium]|nr:MAG: glycoside hydrolase family 19 protein [Chitinophagaceae bacterium]
MTECIEHISYDQLNAIISNSKRTGIFIVHLNETFSAFQINTKLRIAAFMGEVMHESGSFQFMRELASGKAYDGRKDLGNIFPGDGPNFKGRGLLQITGRTNYSDCSKALFGDNTLLKTPDLLASPHYACLSAGWFWNSRGLNAYADQGEPGYQTVTKRINGGLNGWEQRLQYYRSIIKILA